MLNANNVHSTSTQAKRLDKWEYRWLLGLTVGCFFIVSMLTRLLPRALRPFAASSRRQESCFEEARRMANAVIPYAFEW